MFESLQEGLSSALKTLSGKARLTEANMREGLNLVQQSLLEADVSFPVVKDFMARVTEEAVGEKVLASLRPEQQVVGIVHRELVNLMGPVDHSLHLKPDVTILMMCGLQGSGKTTTCGKLARMLIERGRKPMLVAADLQRPAAIHQLHVLGEQIGAPVYSEEGSTDPVAVCQNAVNSAKAFNDALELDGCIMTKLDGDARGGAALSVKHVTGVPLKFIGTGEHLDALEEFHPERMAGRILGMGDVLTLVEQAQQKFDQDEMKEQEERLRRGEFTLDDFRKQLGQIRKLGPLNKVLGLIPGMGGMSQMLGNVDAEADMTRLFGIIDSMTKDERRNPSKVIDQSRRRRIATGAGVEPAEVNQLVKQFDGMADMMKQMAGLGIRDRMKKMQELQRDGRLDPGATLNRQKVGTGKRLSARERADLKKQREKELRKRKRDQKQGRDGDGPSNNGNPRG